MGGEKGKEEEQEMVNEEAQDKPATELKHVDGKEQRPEEEDKKEDSVPKEEALDPEGQVENMVEGDRTSSDTAAGDEDMQQHADSPQGPGNSDVAAVAMQACSMCHQIKQKA